jgi:hypothetical protein
MKQLLVKDDVAKALKDLGTQGKKVTLTSLHACLGNRGSMSTLVRLKTELEGTPPPIADSPAGLKTFREVWALAVTEGRQQQEAVIAQLREELKAVATENERLDGLAVEFSHAKETAETERDSLLAEQRTLQAGLVKGAEQTNQVLEELAEERAARARELAAMRQELAKEVQKVHQMELELVRIKPIDDTPTVTRRGRQ